MSTDDRLERLERRVEVLEKLLRAERWRAGGEPAHPRRQPPALVGCRPQPADRLPWRRRDASE